MSRLLKIIAIQILCSFLWALMLLGWVYLATWGEGPGVIDPIFRVFIYYAWVGSFFSWLLARCIVDG